MSDTPQITKAKYFQYSHISTTTLLLTGQDSLAQRSQLFIQDYFHNKNLVSIMNKFKVLNRKKNALKKAPLAPIATNLELEFHKSQRDSFVSIFIPEPKVKSKRSRSFIHANNTFKVSTRKEPVHDNKSSAKSGGLKEAFARAKRPSRYLETIRREFSDSSLSFESTGSFGSKGSRSSLRKEISATLTKNQFSGNFIEYDILLNCIFLSENDEDSVQLDFASITKLRRVLLICHELVTGGKELLNELFKRFWDLETTKNRSLCRMNILDALTSQTTILTFIKAWVRERPEEFQKNNKLLLELRKRLTNISLTVKTNFGSLLKSVKHLIDKLIISVENKSSLNNAHQEHNIKKENEIRPHISKLTNKTRCYLSQMHKEINLVSLQNIHEIFMVVPAFEVAKQFCIFDLKLISQIRLDHLRDGGKDKTSPNALAGYHFNHFTLFLISLIVKVEQKGLLLSKLVCVANSLYELRNYQGFAILMTALTHTFVNETVNFFLQEYDKELFKAKNDLEVIFDKKNGWRAFKKIVVQASFPMVPFIPVIAQDILRIDAYHESQIKEDGKTSILVNLDKMEMMFETYEILHLSRFSSYDFEPIKLMQDFLQRYYKDVLFSITGSQDIDEMEEVLHRLIKTSR